MTEATAEQGRRFVKRSAYAKVNLALAVGAPIDDDSEHDGMHPIASWMAPIDLADELLVTRLEDDRLSRYAILWHEDAPQKCAPIDWSVRDDLAVRAHLLLEREVGRTLPVQMKLDKRIPVGGGLGGGSSDAAAMLLAVRELFELDLSDDDLRSLAHELGSDVPFFLQSRDDRSGVGPGPAVIEGLGEKCTPVKPVHPSSAHLVLVLPEFGCGTGGVYRAFDHAVTGVDGSSDHVLRDVEVHQIAASGEVRSCDLFNDLGGPAQVVQPKLSAVIANIERAIGATAHVTGSGSTLFLPCPGGEVEAELLAQQLDNHLVGCRAIATRLI
ncbi:MAG: 4-(cytidine 5'-diphospho)-2-C-methyl-D-erythritol kinase [Phycisphaerales bacterium JB050]